MSARTLAQAVRAERIRWSLAADDSREPLLTAALLEEHLPPGSLVRLHARHLPDWYRQRVADPTQLDGRAVVRGWMEHAFLTFSLATPEGTAVQVSIAWQVVVDALVADEILDAQ